MYYLIRSKQSKVRSFTINSPKISIYYWNVSFTIYISTRDRHSRTKTDYVGQPNFEFKSKYIYLIMKSFNYE